MNLQFEALRSYIKTGAKYDVDIPIVKNVIFDIENAKYELEHVNITKILKLEALKKDFHSDSMLDHCRREIGEYHNCMKNLSDELFDSFTINTLKSNEHVEWKEYFHSLYDLIVIDIKGYNDNSVAIVLLKELYKYWDTFEEPKILKPTDTLYPLVESIRQYFKNLKSIHSVFAKDDVRLRLVKRHCSAMNTGKEKRRLRNDIEYNYDVIAKYDEILRWSIK